MKSAQALSHNRITAGYRPPHSQLIQSNPETRGPVFAASWSQHHRYPGHVLWPRCRRARFAGSRDGPPSEHTGTAGGGLRRSQTIFLDEPNRVKPPSVPADRLHLGSHRLRMALRNATVTVSSSRRV
jgi:hypothetical protein